MEGFVEVMIRATIKIGKDRIPRWCLVVKNPSVSTEDLRDLGWIPGLGGGLGNPLQCSCLENPVDRGAWRARVHWVTKSQTQLKQLSTKAWISIGRGVFLECKTKYMGEHLVRERMRSLKCQLVKWGQGL